MDHAEVVVVGAGLAGSSVAAQLAPHAAVTLLDQAVQPGAEASSQNAGMVRRLGEDPWERALAIRTCAWMADPPERFKHASHVTGAVLGLAIDPHWLSDAVAHLRAAEISVEAVECGVGRADGLARIAPALAGSRLQRAWFLPDERVADAHALVSGFVAEAREAGAKVRCGVQVGGVETHGGRVTGVRTDSGPIRADLVVLAAGAWSGVLASRLGLHRPLCPLRRTLVQSAPHPLSRPDHPWVWIDDVGVYARPESGGWLISGCDESTDVPAGPGSRGPVEPEHRALAATKLDQFMPSIADARLVAGWTGLRTFAPDRRPVLGADPELEGLWWAAGLGGFGVTTCFGVGEAVSSWIRRRELDWIRPDGVSPGREFPRRWSVRPTGEIGRAELRETA